VLKSSYEMTFREMGCEVVDWIQLTQNCPVAASCEHCNEATVFTKSGKLLDRLSGWLLNIPWSYLLSIHHMKIILMPGMLCIFFVVITSSFT